LSLVDLHTHSTASDGTDSPTELVTRARDVRLSAVALTDHDTVAGLAEAQAAGVRLGIEVVPGIEIAAALPGRQAELHILGYFIDPASPALERFKGLLVAIRHERNEKLLARLAELGVPIDRKELAEIAPGIVTRAHIADLMVRHGTVANNKEAFSRFLGLGGLAYTEKGKMSFAQAFDVIHDAGGLVAIAHPVHLKAESDIELEILVGRLVDCGADAIEAFHSDHSPATVRKVQRLALRFDLCVTGGSDYHGMHRTARPLGSQRVDSSFLDRLKDRWNAHRAKAKGTTTK
jgi:predicted metal-dependent phosphoesterase TrpH